ncbi:MAG: hypothetical protein ACHQHN_17160 [Sphingobacteriales bacterium]
MSESEYKNLVLADYDNKLTAQLLPSELLLPTPANIKAEIVKICEMSLSTADEKILRSFVGNKEDVMAYRMAVLNGKADPYRPLVNLLGDRSINTNIRNVDLLAMLIGYQPRPYHPSLPLTNNPSPAPAEPSRRTLDPITNSLESPKKRLIKPLLFLVSIILIGIAGFWIWQKSSRHYTDTKGCMIWSDDHYEPVACDDKSSAKPVYPINHQLIDHFRKIKDPKTLTLADVRKVWYAKYNGNVEFFTDSGFYPLDTTRRVLPLTVHILQKYVYHTTN